MLLQFHELLKQSRYQIINPTIYVFIDIEKVNNLYIQKSRKQKGLKFGNSHRHRISVSNYTS